MGSLLGFSGNKTLRLKSNEALEIVRRTEVTYEGLAVSAKFVPGNLSKGVLRSAVKETEAETLVVERSDGRRPQHFHVDFARIVARDVAKDEAQKKNESEWERYQETHPKGTG